jgi:hypothetical protein
MSSRLRAACRDPKVWLTFTFTLAVIWCVGYVLTGTVLGAFIVVALAVLSGLFGVFYT